MQYRCIRWIVPAVLLFLSVTWAKEVKTSQQPSKKEPGPEYRTQAVSFTGNLVLEPKELNKALRATRTKTIIPRLWKSHPKFTDGAVAADLTRLKSLYISRGYFDAKVRLDDKKYDGEKVSLTIAADAGPHYGVRTSTLENAGHSLEFAPESSGDFPARELCTCLLDGQKQAWKEGRIDFRATLEARSVGEPDSAQKWLDLKTKTEPGPQYSVGRIEFRGNKSISDSTLRRAMVLDEGAFFDPARLLRSAARLNAMGLFEPLTGDSIAVTRHLDTHTADVTISLKRQHWGRWFLSGPVGPPGIAGPLEASVMSRLPDWGPSFLQASTYFGFFTMSAFSYPVLKALQFAPQTGWFPLMGLGRPFLPGQSWQSGFVISPQLGWKGMAANYITTQTKRRVQDLLRGEAPDMRGLMVPVARDGGEPGSGGVLICEPQKSRWRWVRMAGAIGVEFLLSSPF